MTLKIGQEHVGGLIIDLDDSGIHGLVAAKTDQSEAATWKEAINLRTGKRNLSEARAQELHNYLVKKGIDKKRIRYHGMAFKQPTGLGDQFDRRVEIEITYMEN